MYIYVYAYIYMYIYIYIYIYVYVYICRSRCIWAIINVGRIGCLVAPCRRHLSLQQPPAQ